MAILAGMLLVLPSSAVNAAKKEDQRTSASSVMDKDWQKALALMQDQSDPVAQKLVSWIYATETNLPIASRDLISFVRTNPDWPRLRDFRRKIEKDIAATAKPYEIAEWFDQNAPSTHDGFKAYMHALLTLGYSDRAKSALSRFWQQAVLSKNETAALAGSYAKYFQATDHAARLDQLIWEGRMEEAETMLAFVGSDSRALGQARIALAQMSPKANALLQKVPQHLQKNPGLLYERMRWRRRQNMNEGALEMLDLAPENAGHEDLWWKEINILARRAIEDKDYKRAYRIIKKHKLTAGADYAQAEWLLGWIALRFLHDPEDAYRRFDKLYQSVQSAISKSRGAYWAARAAEALPDSVLSRQWDTTATAWPSTFYGQLSFKKLYGDSYVPYVDDPAVPEAARQAFAANELVRAVRLLHHHGLSRFADPFLAKLLSLAKDKSNYIMVAELARETDRLYYAVEANKDIQQDLGLFIFTEGYPLLPALPARDPESALVHAIVYRESMFNPLAESPAGARGLMQLMPATAQAVSRQKGRSWKIEKLTEDPQYNVLLGSAYLAKLVEQYNGFYPFAIAAYNAGPGRVTEWTKALGDPRKENIDLIDWIELIPIYETRNYIQRVMETYYMYRLRLSQPPLTVHDFSSPR